MSDNSKNNLATDPCRTSWIEYFTLEGAGWDFGGTYFESLPQLTSEGWAQTLEDSKRPQRNLEQLLHDLNITPEELAASRARRNMN